MYKITAIFNSVLILLLISSCTPTQKNTGIKFLNPAKFDSTLNGKQVKLYTLHNKNGVAAQFTNYGARWLSLWVPDKNGTRRDVVLGFDNLQSYISAGEPYHGSIVGRVAGRIDNGRFTLNGKKYELAHNDLFGNPVKNSLHGGDQGFSFRIWKGEKKKTPSNEERVIFTYHSPDMEEGYPGDMEVKVIYTLTDQNAIKIEYEATAGRPTIVNLTNHAYFNLKGEGNGNILNHKLTILADKYIEHNEELIPTGEIKDVNNTPLDFRTPTKIGKRIHVEHNQVIKDKGFAEGYAISDQKNPPYKKVGELFSPVSGIKMDVFSNQPSLLLYNAWLFDGSDVGKQGKKYVFSGGVALETQGYSDAPNHSGFPSVTLKPGETYNHETAYSFSTE